MKSLTTKLAVAMTTVLMLASASQAHPRLDALRVGYTNECAQLRQERAATLRQARCDHQAALDELKCAERDARKLCEPERSCALATIRAARRRQMQTYRVTVAQIRSSYELALRQAKSRYNIACREVHRVTAMSTLPCGCPVDHCSCQSQPQPCNSCNLPFDHSSALHQWSALVPGLLGAQSTPRGVPVQHVPMRSVTFHPSVVPVAHTSVHHDEAPSYKKRTVTRETVRVGRHPAARRPVGNFLEALMAQL